jgi:hypothetical protein
MCSLSQKIDFDFNSVKIKHMNKIHHSIEKHITCCSHKRQSLSRKRNSGTFANLTLESH